MAYSSITIGGLQCWVDPDTISSSINPMVQVVPAVNGTTFVPYPWFNPNFLNYQESISFSGGYSDISFINGLIGLAQTRAPITLSGLDGQYNGKTFMLLNFNYAPIKPGVLFPGEVLGPGNSVPHIRYTYSINLGLINPIGG